MTYLRYIYNRKMFVALCVVSLIFFSPLGGPFTFLGLLLVFTWPLLIIMFAAPIIIMFWVLTTISYKLGLNIWLSGALVLLFMAIPPFIANQQSRSQTDILLASDLDILEPPLSLSTLGLIVSPNWREEDTNLCGALCLRLLLNGEVNRIAVSTPPAMGDPINWSQVASVYSLQAKSGCRNAATGNNQIDFDATGRRSSADRDEVEAALLAQQALGNCLAKGEMPIGESDGVIFYATIKDGPDNYEAGLDYFANTVKARRLAYYQNSARGMELRYQQTIASYSQRFPFFAFSQNIRFGGSVASELGFLGWETYVGENSGRWLVMEATPLLKSRLGLNLGIARLEAFQAPMQEIAEALAIRGRLSPSKSALLTEFQVSFARASERSVVQAEIALRIWQDRRIQLASSAAMAARAISKSFPQLEPRAAETLFLRLENVETDYTTNADRTRQRMYAAAALSELRIAALTPYFEQMAGLSARKNIGTTALPLVARLGDFGAAGIPPLLNMLDNAGLQPDGRRFQSGSNWTRTYEAAINGLCRVAFSGDADLDKARLRVELESRLQSGVIIYRINEPTTLGMLVSFGMDQEILRPYFRNNNTNRIRFQRRIDAATMRPGCPTAPRR